MFGRVAKRNVDTYGNGSNRKACNWNKKSVSGGTMRPADHRRKILLLSDERLNGKSRLDYGGPWIIRYV